MHQKIKNFSKTNKIFLKNRIFREFFLNAKNCDNKTNIDFRFILKENIITNICNNEFLEKVQQKTPYKGVFLECVLEYIDQITVATSVNPMNASEYIISK